MPTITKTHTPKNEVLSSNRRTSQNYYLSDLVLQHYIQKNLSKEAHAYMQDKYEKLGEQAAGILEELSMLADHKGPELVKRNPYGETINEIRFHPSYRQMMDIAAESEMFYAKWQPDLRQRFGKEAHTMAFVQGLLYCMGEMGQYCPLAMTDGAARLIDRYGDEEDKMRLMPGLSAREGKKLLTGAMFLTEKSGGSDVGANLVSATHVAGSAYHLNGEKWFCSNVNADVIFVLARTNENIRGTRGLSIFLVEKHLPDGSRNPMEIVRIKDKLGVRSMASGECLLQNTVGKLYGKEGEGMKIMLDMIALMRIYNSITAIAGERRALAEAWQHLKYRTTFRRNALQHALIRDKFWELCALYIADFYLVWRTAKALDKADNGNTAEQKRVRFLTPMAKYWSAKNTVYLVRECMELMGGMGYIEDLVMPKLFRDVLVLPIWEGAGNIMILDMLRAAYKTPDGLQLIIEDIQGATSRLPQHAKVLQNELHKLLRLTNLLPSMEQDERETTAKPLFNRLIQLYQIALLTDARDTESAAWIDPTIDYLMRQISGNEASVQARKPLSVAETEALMGWVI